MTASNRDRCSQVEICLGRPLTDGELQPVESLQALTDEQLAVLAVIGRRHMTAPLVFLRAVVPDPTLPEMREVIEHVDAIIAARHPPELANLPLFERYAGRPLSADEKATVATLEDLSPAHRALATMLGRQEHGVAFIYLHRIVPSATTEACSALAQDLAGCPDA